MSGSLRDVLGGRGSSRTLPLLTLLVLPALVGLAGCGVRSEGVTGSPSPDPTIASPAASPTTPASPTAPATPTSTPSPPPPPPDPLTGLPGIAPAPLVAIKVDNGPSARPLQRGLDEAVVVYQELVEGGITRFMALYEGPRRVEVGPVRSARPSDLELLAQHGTPVFGFSGANREVFAQILAAPAVPVSRALHPAAYDKRGRRVVAYNFYTTPRALTRVAGDEATAARDIGWTFGPIAPTAGVAATTGHVAFNPISSVAFTFDPPTGVWRLAQDGRPMTMPDDEVVAPANIVVRFVEVRPGRYTDVLGNHTPVVDSVGSGPVTVLRDGRRLDGTWSRPTPADGTRLLDGQGHDIPLRPGHTWVLLVPDGQSLVTR